MIIDKKGKLFGKINILDIFIILVVLAFIAIFALKILPTGTSGDAGGNKTSLIYTLEVTKKDPSFFDNIKEGDIVFKKNTKNPGGKVVSCETSPAKYLIADHDSAAYRIEETEEKLDGLIKIEVTADISYPDLMVDKEAVKIGKEHAVRTENAVLNGYIVDMEYDKGSVGGFSNDN